MRLSFSIAWRFLSSSKAQTLLIALGIAIGISVQIFIGSLITGLQDNLVETTIGRSSHITILKEGGEGFTQYEEIMNEVEKSQSDIIHISPVTDASGFLREGEETYPILMRGFDFEKAQGIYNLQEGIIEGTLPGKNQIMIGKELKEEGNFDIGDNIEVLTPLGETYEVNISGVYDFQVATINSSWVIGSIPLVQEIFNYEDKITAIETQVKEVFQADILGEEVQSMLSNEFIIENWKDQNQALLSGLNGQSISSLMIQIFVLVSVVLGIASVLAITALQKSRQLGILKAMGITNGAASQVFLFQGLILGVFGSVLGVILGIGWNFLFTTFATNPDGTPILDIPIDLIFILLSALIGIVAATLASLIPARRSSKLDPMEVIKNG